MPGSQLKQCTSCMAQIFVACKRCKACGAEQPFKVALAAKKAKATSDWAAKMRRGHNVPKLIDRASALIHQLNQVGLSPVLLLCHPGPQRVKADLLTEMQGSTEEEVLALKKMKDLYRSLVLLGRGEEDCQKEAAEAEEEEVEREEDVQVEDGQEEEERGDSHQEEEVEEVEGGQEDEKEGKKGISMDEVEEGEEVIGKEGRDEEGRKEEEQEDSPSEERDTIMEQEVVEGTEEENVMEEAGLDRDIEQPLKKRKDKSVNQEGCKDCTLKTVFPIQRLGKRRWRKGSGPEILVFWRPCESW
ncbi:uncharacterized protein LOC134442848 [Engraulis encrasicolus]|uniref:uncharacterized protein LOC134442848 n=1 Tax=Engraulis encrasicolus TaxID=184585 RepID=UPI002FD07C70